MKTSLIITTINNSNKNIKLFDRGCKKKNWSLIIIGDRKTPKSFRLENGNFFSIDAQKNFKFRFAKICPENNYARKNIGYLYSIKNKSEIMIETDDDNTPKKNFFNDINIFHNVYKIKNKSWVNIYDIFLKKKTSTIWPRGLPLDEIFRNKIKVGNQRIKKKFLIQQGMAENNPDVDAIFRLINEKINIKFKNYKVSLGGALSPFNSQNTIWHNSIFELMYLPVTCSMRCTDIWRSLIALKLMKLNKKEILFFGTTMYQNRNQHNLINDFNLEIPIYLKDKFLIEKLNGIKLKKGLKNLPDNLKKCYKILIENKIFHKKELYYLNAWLKDCEKLRKKITL